jgi:hypothetical protein
VLSDGSLFDSPEAAAKALPETRVADRESLATMRRRMEPSYVSDARRRVAEGKKRIARQQCRVERIRVEGRDSTRAAALLETFLRTQARREQYLQAVLRAFEKSLHGRQLRYLRYLRGRSRTRRAKSGNRAEKFAQWDKEVRAFLERQYPDAPDYKGSLLRLWEKYLSLGLPNAHFVSEFTSGKKEALFQRAWEMMLARHLDAQGHQLTTADEGPDFRFEHNGRTVWVEAVSPEPRGVPDHWLEKAKPGEVKVGDVPHNEVLLRWTAAIKAKSDKLKEYRDKGIVGRDDAYVIAINGCQLGAFPLQHGVSRLPYAVEAVYPVGPVAIPIDRTTGQVGRPFVSIRPGIHTAKGAPVSTSLFNDPAYSDVSAIIACSLDRSEAASLPVDIVHNHFASVPVPEGILGKNGEEWMAKAVANNEIELRRLETDKGPKGGT